MSKSDNNPKTVKQKAVEMVKDPKKIITKPIATIKMYTEDTREGKQRRSKLTEYAREHPVKTAALAGAMVASGVAVGAAALVAAPIVVASPVVAVGLVGAVAFGSSLVFRTASQKLNNLAEENRQKPGIDRKAGMSRRDTKTLANLEALNQGTYKEEVNQSKIKQALANGGNKIVENLQKFNTWRKNTEENKAKAEQNSDKSFTKNIKEYYTKVKKKDDMPSR